MPKAWAQPHREVASAWMRCRARLAENPAASQCPDVKNTTRTDDATAPGTGFALQSLANKFAEADDKARKAGAMHRLKPRAGRQQERRGLIAGTDGETASRFAEAEPARWS